MLQALIGLVMLNTQPIPFVEEVKPITALETPFTSTVVTETPRTETLEEVSDRIADEYKISREKLRNLVYSESRWKPDAVSKTGDFGLVQINLLHNPDVTKEQALDPEFSLKFAAEKLSKGRDYLWTSCSCWSLVESRLPKLPRMASVIPNSSLRDGSVIILNYKGVKHIALVEKIVLDSIHVIESNFEPCEVGRRVIDIHSPNIVGYFSVV